MNKSILFVCTGNIFRSYIAEAILSHLAKNAIDRKELNIRSAGILLKNKNPNYLVKNVLKNNLISLPKKQATQLNKSIINEASIIITMARNHSDYIKSNYCVESILFNKLCYNIDENILDLPEVFPEWKKLSTEEIELYVHKIFFHIYAGLSHALPKIIGNYHE